MTTSDDAMTTFLLTLIPPRHYRRHIDKNRLISAIAFRQHSVDRTNTIGASTQQQTGSSSSLERIGSDRLGMDITTSQKLVS